MSYFQQLKSGESSWWSWIAVTFMIIVAWIFFGTILFEAIEGISDSLDPALFEGPDSKTLGSSNYLLVVMGASPLAYALMLLSFPVALIGLYFGQKYIHIRTLTALHTSAKRFRFSRAIQGFFLAWTVLGAFALIGQALGFIEINYVFNGEKFWIYAFVSLLFIPLQSATEEIIFRGYFNQGLTHLLRSKWIAFALTSLAFMALHLSNPEALEGAASGTLPIVMSGYFFFGFAMCLIVWTLYLPNRFGPCKRCSFNLYCFVNSCGDYMVLAGRLKKSCPFFVKRHTVHCGRIGLANQGSASPDAIADLTTFLSIGSPN